MLETLAFFWSFFFSEEATAFRLPELQSCFVARCLQFLLWHQPVIQCQKLLQTLRKLRKLPLRLRHRQKLRLRRMDLPFILRKVTMILIMTTVIMILLTILIRRKTVLWMIQGRRMIIQIQEMDLLMMETMIRHRLTRQGMILPIRLIIPSMTVPVTAQMVLWITLIHERKFSR